MITLDFTDIDIDEFMKSPSESEDSDPKEEIAGVIDQSELKR